MKEPKLTILTISFNSWHYLEPCLKSIYESDFPIWEIIVIDNASVDGSQEKIRQYYPDVKFIQNNENVGHTRAVNQGCKLATGDCILLLDNDIELRPDAIRKMVEYLDHHGDTGMVAPRILNTDGSIQESARNFPSAINGIFGRQSILTRMFPNNPISKRYLSTDKFVTYKPYKVQHVSAACMMFRMEMYQKIGKWDEGYHSYWVDADWCMRMQKSGFSIYCIPDAVITHHEQVARNEKKSSLRIIKFHMGAFRFYRLYYTWGKYDPRCLIAGLLLTIRTLILLTTNAFKKSPEIGFDPLSIQKQK